NDAAVQIMTIHKAKGLEFDVVILPSLGKITGRDSAPLLSWIERPQQPAATQLLMSPIHSANERNEVYGYLRQLDRERQQQEQKRILYVACTRAKNTLHLLGHAPTNTKGQLNPRAGTLLHDLWPAVRDIFESQHPKNLKIPELSSLEPTEIAPRALWRRCSADVARSLSVLDDVPTVAERQIDIRPAYLWAGQQVREIGRLVHRWLMDLSRLDCALSEGVTSDEIIEVANHRVSQLALNETDKPTAVETVITAVTHAIQDKRFQWLIDSSHTDAHSEYALTGWLNDQWVNVVIDRTFVDTRGVRWIVDYKTSQHLGGELNTFLDQEQQRYRPQLDRYARLIQLKEPGRAICCGLYFPLLNAWKEWPVTKSQGASSASLSKGQ
ncbi:MAG: hypothetical protein HKM24_00955, partial [Gammaproteobacteria bacterium]|nr:hypothetical protein [Gammaproteobacteria bacterium]